MSNVDGGLTDGLPVHFQNDGAVLIANRTVHGGVRAVSRRYPHIGVLLVVIESPED
jgi:hypothetical protein